MRAIAQLCDSDAANKLNLIAPPEILYRDDVLEKQAAQCSEFWYAHKLVWLNERKRIEHHQLPKQPPLGSYFEHPERDWAMVRLLAKENTPDLIFYRRRSPDHPESKVFDAASPELDGILPAPPLDWQRTGKESDIRRSWKVPESFRGKLTRLEMIAASPQVEPFTLLMRFKSGKAVITEYLLKPYLYPEGGKEFFSFTIPANANQCDLTLRFSSKVKAVHFESFRVVLSDPEEHPNAR
jgi:hypothetical protein